MNEWPYIYTPGEGRTYLCPRYIVAQILGAYIAGIIVYGQYKNFIVLAEGVLAEAGLLESTQFTPNGPPGIFALYLSPEQSLGRAFLTEFVMVRYTGRPMIPPLTAYPLRTPCLPL